MSAPSLLAVEKLCKYFPLGSGVIGEHRASIKAVDQVSFSLDKGETIGVVGESGCGKTTLGRVILKLIEPTSGRIIFDGQDITTLDSEPMRLLRRRMQIVFQDPLSSLNPRIPIGDAVAEPLKVFQVAKGPKLRKMVMDLLDTVGIPGESFNRYPHEFSGGQKQRIGIARAIALNPDLIVADEPVSALDVSIQAQIINLLKDLQKQMGLSYVFISHDLSVVRYISNRVMVMYLGRVMELSDSDSLYSAPLHPYTQALLKVVPEVGKPFDRGAIIRGDVPDQVLLPSGCPFHPRCPKVESICSEVVPELEEKRPGRLAACHFAL